MSTTRAGIIRCVALALSLCGLASTVEPADRPAIPPVNGVAAPAPEVLKGDMPPIGLKAMSPIHNLIQYDGIRMITTIESGRRMVEAHDSANGGLLFKGCIDQERDRAAMPAKVLKFYQDHIVVIPYPDGTMVRIKWRGGKLDAIQARMDAEAEEIQRKVQERFKKP